jgi:hypothetical protein
MSISLTSTSRHVPGQSFGEVVSHFLAPFLSVRDPNASLAGLPDRILIDIGLDPRDVPTASGHSGSFRSAAKS